MNKEERRSQWDIDHPKSRAELEADKKRQWRLEFKANKQYKLFEKKKLVQEKKQTVKQNRIDAIFKLRSERKSLEEIAAVFGITGERIRQIIKTMPEETLKLLPRCSHEMKLYSLNCLHCKKNYTSPQEQRKFCSKKCFVDSGYMKEALKKYPYPADVTTATQRNLWKYYNDAEYRRRTDLSKKQWRDRTLKDPVKS